MHLVRLPADAPRQTRRAGFSLVELLIVIGIILILLAIVVPVLFTARRQSEINRAKADLNVIALGLEEYKKVFRDYPRPAAANVGSTTVSHHNLLAYHLIGPEADGIRAYDPVSGQSVGKKWGPYIPPDKFKLDTTAPNADFTNMPPGGPALLDRFGEIKYYPKYTNNQGALVGTVTGTPKAMFNKLSGEPDSANPEGGLTSHLQWMLGDGEDDASVAQSNSINGTEKLRFSGPFILISPGPDRAYGLKTDQTDRTKVDDVYNFER